MITGGPYCAYKGVDWIDLAQATDKWWAVLNTAMNIRVT
jgi:hypothetical protein